LTTKELIQAELEKIPEQRLDELYLVVKQFAGESALPGKNKNLMAKLRKIQIDGPVDFAENLDKYLYEADH